MDETTVYLNSSPKRTVHPKGERIVSIRVGGLSYTRLALEVSVAMDGTKLHFFVIFKGKPGGSVERSLPYILPADAIGCVQLKAWMDDRTMSISYQKVFRAYMETHDGNVGLLLDDFICHKSDTLQSQMDDDNALLYIIPPHYTGLLQPRDVGINKSLKDRLKEAASDWRREKHSLLGPGRKLPSPDRKDILLWLRKIWKEFPVSIVRNSCIGSGYYYEDGIDYNGETESDSDIDDK